MLDDSFLWGLFRWSAGALPSRLSFVAYGELPADFIITQLKAAVANDDE